MIELCKVVPEIGSAVLLDERAKFANLDFHNYGTFSPRDVKTIANTLNPSLFTTVKPYNDKEINLAQLFTASQSTMPKGLAKAY